MGRLGCILYITAFLILAHQTWLFSEPQRLAPLTETLQGYGIHQMPSKEDYPESGAVVVLSEQEYRQFGEAHEKRIHKIIKILTHSGSSAATVALPCPTSCRIEGRTIKSDGRMIALPSRDVVRSQNRSEFSSAFSAVQFVFPSAEPGDVLEYIATLSYVEPFFVDDYRFAENYPVLKGVLILTHPDDFSYSYIRVSPPDTSVSVRTDQVQEATFHRIRTIFVVNNVAALAEEPYSSGFQDTNPGVRLFIQVMSGHKIDFFTDWQKFGGFIGKAFIAKTLRTGPIKDFVQEQISKSSDPTQQLRSIHDAADRRIEIDSSPGRALSGFPYQTAEEVFKSGWGTPEDFALFLATCYRNMNWAVDLILVNSSEKPRASATSAFPPDLDLVLLKVKTTTGEFYIDCNSNGMNVGMLSSSSMNRFAVGIPVLMDFQSVPPMGYVMATPSLDVVQSRMDVTLRPEAQAWNLQAHWSMQGDLYQQLSAYRIQEGDARLSTKIGELVRSELHARIQRVDYKMQAGEVVVDATGSVPRRSMGGGITLLQSPAEDAGLHLSSSLFQDRGTPVILPIRGEVSVTYHIQPEAGQSLSIPQSYRVDCNPVQYTFSAGLANRELTIEEKWLIRDLKIAPESFPKFLQLAQYASEAHHWSVLSSATDQFSASPIQNVSLIPFASVAPTQSLAIHQNQKIVTPAAALSNEPQVPCADAQRVQLTGSLNKGNLLIRVKNLTSQPIDNFDLIIEYTAFGRPSSRRAELHQDVSIPPQASHFIGSPEEAMYDSARITVRFSQKGVSHQCGPFQIGSN